MASGNNGDPGTIADGRYPLSFDNRSGKGADSVYVTILTQRPNDPKWYFIDSEGNFTPVGEKSQQSKYTSAISFKLSELQGKDPDQKDSAEPSLSMPPGTLGTRVYVSLDEPLKFILNPDSSGYSGIDPVNPGDPNHDTAFDWYELAYAPFDNTPLGINTTQVDMMGLPTRVTVDAGGEEIERGIRLDQYGSTKDIIKKFTSSYPEYAEGLTVNNSAGRAIRLAAPRTMSYAKDFLPTAFDDPITQFWNSATESQPFSFSGTGPWDSVTGFVVDDQFRFTLKGGPDDGSSYSMPRPGSADIFRNAGVFTPPISSNPTAGQANPSQGQFLAQLAAAFTRGVANQPLNWNQPSAYYQGISNDYAKFFHSISTDKFAYAFPYDDVNSQSSVIILPGNAPTPDRVTLSFGGLN